MKYNPLTEEIVTSALASITKFPEIADQVGREILESRFDPGAWAAALSESEGNRQKALSGYARIRMESLEKHHRARIAKIDSFESRRVNQCLGPKRQASLVRSVRELLDSPRPGKVLNFMKPSLSPMWLMILWVGSAGTLATLGHLSSARFSWGGTSHLTSISLFCGLMVVGGALLLYRALPKPWIMQCWNSGLVATCNLVCLSSLFLGAQVIKRSMAMDGVPAPDQQHVLANSAGFAKPGLEPSGKQYLVSTETVDVKRAMGD